MSNYYIPIIGAISAGKSTFLKAFLGINVLETGQTTTTKFICFIKHSNETKFYHVIPKYEKTLTFIKEGIETKGDENIKKRIEDINSDLTNRKGTQNDIFYMLETEIKTIENIPLLEKCYFMDIPGLNENDNSYIEDIFSLITINDIKFEIVVFDATTVENDNIKKIFERLQKKGCLTIKNNIYVLNKIDQCTRGGEEDIIDTFKKKFYESFEDEKNKEKVIHLNIYENYFVPLNSILYNAECKIKEDFLSLLIFELYTYLENKQYTGLISFHEHIKKTVETIIQDSNLEIKNEINSLNEKEIEIINNSLDEINKLTLHFEEFSLGIDFKNKKKIWKANSRFKKIICYS